MQDDVLAVSVKRAAELCGLSKFTVAAKVRCGELPVIRVGRRVLIGLDDLRAWLQRHRQNGAPAAPVIQGSE